MNQGEHSSIKRVENRTVKIINDTDAYGSRVDPYKECEILKVLTKLGPEFPQNVKCEGPFKLSYDYIEGMTLEEYSNMIWKRDNDLPSQSIQSDILIQVSLAYCKMYKVGFAHGDPNLKNFLINEEGKIFIIDFGFAYKISEHPISFHEILSKLYESFYYDEFIDEETYETLNKDIEKIIAKSL